MTLKRITWLDITGADEAWMTRDDVLRFGREKSKEFITTTGYIIHKTKQYLLVAGTHDKAADTFSDVNMIPTGMVKKIETLK